MNAEEASDIPRVMLRLAALMGSLLAHRQVARISVPPHHMPILITMSHNLDW